ncbi:MAG: CHRD domain-containing protein [Chloroflexia bacterium]|nr:CHRD domain-containing protein [Chloroflexia bacterium]
MRKLGLSTLLIIALLAISGAAFTANADDGGRKFTTTLLGANERPGPGDPDGTGVASLRLNPGAGQVCYTITYINVNGVTAGHIHRAPADSPGPVVVGLYPIAPDTGPDTDGTIKGCVSADRSLILGIIQNPEDYYVNLHNDEYRAGSIRGQLAK